MPFLNAENVPLRLRHLIPLAEEFGVTDDLEREHFILATPPDKIALLKSAVAEHDDDLDEWLAGPEADSFPFSNEYIAFSAMRMAADFA